MNELDLIMFISQYSTTLKNVYSLSISTLAIFRKCMLYIELIGFRNGCVQLSETKPINFFDAFTVIASEVTYICTNVW
jgi:hypothetical protein